jgi:BRCA1 C Terminus (BRCT) domain
MMDHEDHSQYRTFCEQQILEKSVNTLIGIVEGITADRETTAEEIDLLNEWMVTHSPYERLHPFNEFFPLLSRVLEDGILDESERADIDWLARKVIRCELLDTAKGDMQVLHGLLQGIIADGQIKKVELVVLQEWLGEHEHLRRVWPYDEIESLLMSTLADGIVDQNEHRMLMAFLQDFCELKPENANGEVQHAVTGVCAVCPDIEFEGKKFAITGASERLKRSEFEDKIAALGGIPHPRVTKDLDYLVIGAGGNPCWAYACYGRKVELAMKLRREGSQLLLIHENDLWDAILDVAG